MNSLTLPPDNDLLSLSPFHVHQALHIDLAYSSLKQFIYLTWHLIEPVQKLVWNWHLDIVCDRLEEITTNGCCNERVAFNLPPGSGKSLIISVFWPTWEWIRRADYRYLIASYSDKNTIRDNRNARTILTSPLYQQAFWHNYLPFGQGGTPRQVLLKDTERAPSTVTLTKEQWAKIRFDTTEKGWRIATSVNGQGTGDHPHRIIGDDLHKVGEAHSKVKLEEVRDYWTGTLSTRIGNDPAIVLVGQRVDVNDIFGFILSDGNWDHVSLPMRYVEIRYDKKGRVTGGHLDCPCHSDGPDPLDPREIDGELLFPDRYPEAKVLRMEIDLDAGGLKDSDAQLGQNPSLEKGVLVTREMLPVVAHVDYPPGCNNRTIRGWDDAASKDGDSTSGTKVTLISNCRFDRDVEVLMYSSPFKVGDEVINPIVFVIQHNVNVKIVDADPTILATAHMDGRGVEIREEREGGSSGKKVTKYHETMLQGYDFREVILTGSKAARFRPFAAECRKGNVVVIRGEWTPNYIANIIGFPLAKHDDDADSTSCAVNELLLEPPKVVHSAVIGMGKKKMNRWTRDERDRKGRVVVLNRGRGFRR